MHNLDLKPTHAPLKKYYETLEQLEGHQAQSEGNVEHAFIELLIHCAKKMGENWTVIPKRPLKVSGRNVIPDATVIGEGVTRGYWEAKDSSDDLAKEIKAKFALGYPKDNILFWEPKTIALFQNGAPKFGPHPIDSENADNLVQALKQFYEYSRPHIEDWDKAVLEFKKEVPRLAALLKGAIEKERKKNRPFIEAFDGFFEVCKQAINPNLDIEAVEGMLIQHLLVERIFRKVFEDPDFVRRNVIASEIEKVISTLTFNREQFLKPYDYFYKAIEENAANAKDYVEKQTILNTIYERFFQGWSVREADTLGIVYTPQEIVDFMVCSVEELLLKEFKRSLSDERVQILDPFVGTGNFLLRVMREVKPSRLAQKYENELHCNEIMLMPYYIACMNIEHEYRERTGQHKAFPGICLVDTFDIRRQATMFVQENTRRIQRQNEQPIFVVVGNPPYNAWQVTENDNNKNRKYEELDERVLETYGRSSRATNKSALADMYVKAFRWASDRVVDEGIVAFVSNNGFLDGVAFDGFRKNLAADFGTIYHLNLKGNARTSGIRRQREGGNVFDDLIRVGVGITFLVKHARTDRRARINYAEVEDFGTAKDKQDFLRNAASLSKLKWKLLSPDSAGNWLHTADESYSTFIPLGVKGQETSIFAQYSLAPNTARDAWVYNFSEEQLEASVLRTIDTFNAEVDRFKRSGSPEDIDSWVLADAGRISWSRDLKKDLLRGNKAEFASAKVRVATYRPFSKMSLFFDRVMNEEIYQFRSILPDVSSEREGRILSVTSIGSEKPFLCLTTNTIPNYHLSGAGSGTQSFPFYFYDEDGSNRRENITAWALEQFRAHYKDKKITKWDIFHYTYAVLHDPVYRDRYAANLKRELPRIPYAPDFHAYAKAGKRLAELHVEYEKQKPFPLQTKEKQPFTWRVEKMRLSKDKQTLTYNDCLTLTGIPQAAFAYRLGNRSALEWVIDQYQVSTDKRSGIVNDPNREDDPEYIFRLIGQVITVSMETVNIVNALPGLGLPMPTSTKSEPAAAR